jgi:two-component system chemotaxis response regulator CheB
VGVPRIRVLVVDDSVVVRRLVTQVLQADPDLDVVGTAPNGQVALEKLAELRPDVVTMDVEMPVMDGIAAVKALRMHHPRLPVIMFSTLTERGAAAALDALAAGANDYVTKPSHSLGIADSLEGVAATLIPKIKALFAARRTRPGARHIPGPATPCRQTQVHVVVIGASTGGPDALTRIIGDLPDDFAVPIVVVQHMPKVFTKLFADRLNRTSALGVVEADDGAPLVPGQVLVAPGDFHLSLERAGAGVLARLSTEAPENYCRPAVDVLFRSAAQTYGDGVLAVILTGMGQDGRRGCEEVRAAGGRVVVQDEDSSVVWGMPGAVAVGGHADDIVPLGDIPKLLLAAAGGGAC